MFFHGTNLHNNNVSPDLTPDEVTKIQKNIIILKKFYKDLYMVQGNIITEVWAILKTKGLQSSSNTTETWLRNILASCGVICSFIAIGCAATGVGIGFAIAAAAIAATAAYVAANMNSNVVISNDVTGDMGYAASLNNTNFNKMIQVFI